MAEALKRNWNQKLNQPASESPCGSHRVNISRPVNHVPFLDHVLLPVIVLCCAHKFKKKSKSLP